MSVKQDLLAQLRELYGDDESIRNAAHEWLMTLNPYESRYVVKALREIAAGKFVMEAAK